MVSRIATAGWRGAYIPRGWRLMAASANAVALGMGGKTVAKAETCLIQVNRFLVQMSLALQH